MQSLNLAQAKILERSYCRQHINRRVKGIGALGVVMALALAGSFALRCVISNRAEQVGSELVFAQARCKQARSRVATTETEKRQAAWIGQLSRKSEQQLNILGSILQCVPEGVWLSRVQSSDRSPVISVEGSALSFRSLMSFTDRLRRCPGFTDVRLRNTTVNEGNGVETVEFSVQMQIPTPGTSAPASGSPPPAAVPKV